MRRVVVTGMGVVSCLGNDLETVRASLWEGRSGIRYQEEYERNGMRSHVAGGVLLDLEALIPPKILRFMGPASAYGYLSMEQAIADAGLDQEQLSHLRTGIIAGSGGASPSNQVEAVEVLNSRGLRRVGPYRVTRVMGNTVSACLASAFHIRGVNYSISSACATSAHCIGNAMELIQMGKQDLMFAGGAEEEHWTLSCLFDAMGALSRKYNNRPEAASRAYDVNRDGFVISGGGGMLVLEEMEHALARNARIYAELVAYGATSDGFDMVAPSGEGAARCMSQALATLEGPLDYINAHGTGTPAGDIVELNAIRSALEERGDPIPPINSTKSLSGHSLGAAGVQEAIYTLLMQRDGFIAASANIEDLDPGAADMPIVRKRQSGLSLERAMSNSFGFGGTNACLIFQRTP